MKSDKSCFLFFSKGFDVQMKGPKIPGQNLIVGPGSSNDYYTILRKPGSARSADISTLDPKRTYRFRVIPKARTTEGEPSEVHRISPGAVSADLW